MAQTVDITHFHRIENNYQSIVLSVTIEYLLSIDIDCIKNLGCKKINSLYLLICRKVKILLAVQLELKKCALYLKCAVFWRLAYLVAFRGW